jgi:HAMP domain-containing protein
MRLSLKLAAICLISAAAPSLLILLALSSRKMAAELPREVLIRESRAALSLFEKRLSEMKLAAQRLANQISLKISQGEAARAELQDLLANAREQMSLDFLIVADKQGRVLARHNNLPAPDENILSGGAKNLLAERVISGGEPMAACLSEGGQMLSRLDLELPARVQRKDGSALEEALIIEAAAPIFNRDQFVGIVLIGQMLNNYYKFPPGASGLKVPLVAEVRQTLYPDQASRAGAILLLGDTVVASSLIDSGNVVLLGARVSASQEAIDGYAVWLQPIKSLDGSQIGSLGIAVRAQGDQVNWLSLVILSLALMAAGIAGYRIGASLSSRLVGLSEAVSRMSVGELSTPVRDGHGPSADEIGQLAQQLEQMRESFRQAVGRLRRR